jgi:hypothetical protein
MSTPLSPNRRRIVLGVYAWTTGMYGALLCPARADAAAAASTRRAANSDISAQTIAIDKWYSQLAKNQISTGSLIVQRLGSGWYCLKEEYVWDAARRLGELDRIVVPAGFVTNLSSIPALLWPVLPPRNVYAIPTVLHSYLYWTQELPRSVADKVFVIAMRDADVDDKLIRLFASAIGAFGERAWQANAAAKKKGERRFLRVVPVESGMDWEHLKAMPDAFVD